MYSKKLHLYFKSKGISQIEIARKLGSSPSMIGRYLSGSVGFKPEFLSVLIKHYPDIDLQYIFSDNETKELSEPSESYGSGDLNLFSEIENIEKKLSEIKEYLTRKCHDI